MSKVKPTFPMPGNTLNASVVRTICKYAKSEYKAIEAASPKAADLPSLEELRETARLLLPLARKAASQCDPIFLSRSRYDQTSGREFDIEGHVVEVTPIFAYFALVVMAIFEAEEGGVK